MSALTLEIAALSNTLKTLTKRFTSDSEASADLVQDTMLKALTYQHKFEPNTNLRGWLFTIMKNTFINNYRKSRQARVLHDNSKDLYFLNVKDDHTFNVPDNSVEYKDIWRNIDELREEYRVPLKLHISGYKYHEIAGQLGMPIGTVKNRIFNARKEIQKKLTGY